MNIFAKKILLKIHSAYLKIVSLTDDHSRVILESTENGDYINANFIKVCN